MRDGTKVLPGTHEVAQKRDNRASREKGVLRNDPNGRNHPT